jgi:cytoskeletal protein CcmA (bactofilin family)
MNASSTATTRPNGALSTIVPSPGAHGHPGRLGPGLVIEGDVIAGEDVILDGRLSGGLHAPEHAVTIAAGATLRGGVFARVVIVEGAVHGDVTATGLIEVAQGARVEGDLTAPAVAIAEGAFVVGKIDMRRAEAAARVARYRAERPEGRTTASA